MDSPKMSGSAGMSRVSSLAKVPRGPAVIRPRGMSWVNIPEPLIEDCVQLVKANSIEGNKKDGIDVVFTPWSNLKKTPAMDVGQVGFKEERMVKKVRVEKRSNEIVNRLNKTKEEREVDLMAEQETRMAKDRAKLRESERLRREAEQVAIKQKKEQAELRSYTSLMKESKMTANSQFQGKDFKKVEEDFM